MAVIVKIVGGLASQLHKYAVGRALSIRYGQELKLDLSWFESIPAGDTPRKLLLDRFYTTYSVANHKEIASLRGGRLSNALARRLNNLFNTSIGKSTRFSGARLQRLMLDISANVSLNNGAYIEGELVGDAAFSQIREILNQEFMLRREFITDEMLTIANVMNGTNSVAIHIRRGDYLTNPNASSYHLTCDIQYFSKALDLLRCKHQNNMSSVYLFSDDLNWLRENIADFPDGAQIIDSFTDEQNFFLMCQCKNFIISNSGFSWLAAWIGRSDDGVVFAPGVWLKNVDDNKKHIENIMFDGMVLVENG